MIISAEKFSAGAQGVSAAPFLDLLDFQSCCHSRNSYRTHPHWPGENLECLTTSTWKLF